MSSPRRFLCITAKKKEMDRIGKVYVSVCKEGRKERLSKFFGGFKLPGESSAPELVLAGELHTRNTN
jgi:hypothetical protein